MEVLIVEDDLISRSMLKKPLTQMGHQVVEAGNGEQAWRLLKKRPIQVVITDWMMPEMDGLELCRNIRGERFDRYIYIMVVTSKDNNKDLVEVFKCGADDYITKPFDPDELKGRIMAGARVIDHEDRHRAKEKRLLEDTKNERIESALGELEKTQAQMLQQMLQSEKMASIGQLAAGVAHEINNPTGFISSNLRTLQDYQNDFISMVVKYRDFIKMVHALPQTEGQNGDLHEAASEIETLEKKIDIDFLLEDMVDLVSDCREGADRIKRIVLDLKNFAHPGDDRFHSIDINSGLESTLNVVHNELKYKATVERVLGDIPEVQGCPQQLNQVFMNILINAAQAMEKKGIIKVETRAVDSMVEVIISDSGCGIAPDHIKRIFDPFFTTKEVGKGTGLGMNIAYSIIQKHQGSIDVVSEQGNGATFTIRLPVTAEGEAVPAADGLIPDE